MNKHTKQNIKEFFTKIGRNSRLGLFDVWYGIALVFCAVVFGASFIVFLWSTLSCSFM